MGRILYLNLMLPFFVRKNSNKWLKRANEGSFNPLAVEVHVDAADLIITILITIWLLPVIRFWWSTSPLINLKSLIGKPEDQTNKNVNRIFYLCIGWPRVCVCVSMSSGKRRSYFPSTMTRFIGDITCLEIVRSFHVLFLGGRQT